LKPPCLPDSAVLAAKACYQAALKLAAPDLVSAGERLLARISPPNWALEWSLPTWLGAIWELSPSTVADLVLSNVYGLAYIRLQDDLADGEVAESDLTTALLLSTVLYQRWMLLYVRLFASGSRFWGFLDRYMSQWVRATLRSSKPAQVAFRAYSEADLHALGQRGAPLKICVAGACLLAGQVELIPQLEAALDHLLIGAVLLDHARDWTEDLVAGRYNAFVAHASPLAQAAEHVEANRRAVLQELMVGKGARPYFALLRQQLQIAIDGSRAAGVLALADYVTWLRNQADAYGKRAARDARGQLYNLAGQVLSAIPAPMASGVS
jgi:hypothetical protein